MTTRNQTSLPLPAARPAASPPPPHVNRACGPLTAEQLKQQGMDRAAENRADALRAARWHARCLGQKNGWVTSDDVAARMVSYEALGNAAGSIFRGSEWRFADKWVRSSRPSSHARMIRLWLYVGPPPPRHKWDYNPGVTGP